MMYDLTPLFRTAIGFDRLARLVDTAQAAPAASSYPPYNIEKTGEDSYRLTMAVAGFSPDDIEMVVRDNTLVITGRAQAEEQQGEILYRGIAGRPFERRFVLADHIQVDGADLQNGLLHVGLKRIVPEALKPRRIAIGSNGATARPVLANDAEAPARPRNPAAWREREGPERSGPFFCSDGLSAQPGVRKKPCAASSVARLRAISASARSISARRRAM